ncbi:MAG TPA: D-alanine--D-alanine ligase family protein, partial [Thermomicrobiales bacterium]|nr:D-alanine--D-alanine ligase family protein [Thermomicrobiales bacterium]
ARYNVRTIGITRDGGWITGGDPMAALKADSPFFQLGDGQSSDPSEAQVGPPALSRETVDVVFPVLHGPMGEDGTVQGMLELAGIPYVGAGVLGSSVAMDKAMCKLILSQAGIPGAPWILVNAHEWDDAPAAVIASIEEQLGYPCFVKPANMGSSVGVSKAHDREELQSAMQAALLYDRRIVVETGIIGRELEISVLGNERPRASVAGEIKPGNEFYDFNSKYVDDNTDLIIPAELPADKLAEMQEIAVRAFRALDLAGMARVDFFLETDTNRLLVNEVNTIPGFTSISMYPMLWEASGLPLQALVSELVELAIARHKRPHRV